MAKKGRSRGLGAGHLLGIFFLLAMAMGVVFALGYALGRSQYDAQFRKAVTDVVGEPAGAAARLKPIVTGKSAQPTRRGAPDKNAPTEVGDRPATSAPDWDYYHSAEPAKANEKLRPQAQPNTTPGSGPGSGAPPAAASPSVPAKSQSGAAAKAPPRPPNAPLIPKGSITLQVAALGRESDAVAMAQTLRQKKFPAFVLSPDTDKFYRVQVGPYADAKSADAARQRLEAAGFKTIIKK